jgi:nitrite reductase (NADH) large subunit
VSSVALPLARGKSYWRVAQWLGVALTLALVVGLVVAPKLWLHVLWDMVIPLLPMVFLVNPLIWRNVCPLATVNDLTGRSAGRAAMPMALMRNGWILGMTLLFVLVPARRFLFNENGVALAATIVAVIALAAVGGLIFARRAGFCGSICPVLPVEKLYGQLPMVDLKGARCDACSVCTPVGCIDLAGQKTVAQTVGPQRRDSAWIRTSFGAFAAMFPGFVLGYFTAENGSFASAPAVYLRVLICALGSYSIVAAAVTVFRLRATPTLRVLGAVAFVTYYWFALPVLVRSYTS